MLISLCKCGAVRDPKTAAPKQNYGKNSHDLNNKCKNRCAKKHDPNNINTNQSEDSGIKKPRWNKFSSKKTQK
jgi:hypothetical protein